jgi:aspartyl-tRNA(Asn)/glutamyl-tRNA(Gln) amidotransferase subunit A
MEWVNPIRWRGMQLRSLSEASRLVRGRQISPVELTRDSLKQIAQLNPTLNAFILVLETAAMVEAREAEREIESGRWRGPLHGIPMGVKDLIDTRGLPTTAASAVFRDRVPTEDAEVMRQLKHAGGILLGKQNLHEFAYGGSSLISHFGPVRNPVNPECIAGGSSGGSAAAVRAGMCYAAIGTDTAGSVREPAALCGVVGLKPSYGLLSTQGVIPLSPSLDHLGLFTQTVEDAAIVLDALTEGSGGDYQENLRQGLEEFVIGIPQAYFFEDLDSQVEAKVEEAIEHCKRLATSVREVHLPLSTDRTLQSAEAYSYHRQMLNVSAELYQPETIRRIRTGENVTQEQYQDSLRRLEEIREQTIAAFRGIDACLMPTTPMPAPRIEDLTRDLTQLRPAELILLRNTRPVNVWGVPAISVPCGSTRAGLPIGLQIVGPPRGEAKILALAHAYEKLVLPASAQSIE